MSNVYSLPYDDLAEPDTDQQGADIIDYMIELGDWCEARGVDTSSIEYRHQASVIMSQLQVILMSKER